MEEELGGERPGGDGGKDRRSLGAGGRCRERPPPGGHPSPPQVAGWRGQGWTVVPHTLEEQQVEGECGVYVGRC